MNRRCYGSSENVLTTHQKALFINWEHHHTIIFDEDPLGALLAIESISTSDLDRLASFASDEDKALIRTLRTQIEENKGVQRRDFALFNSEDAQQAILDASCKWDGSILRFLECDYWLRDSYDAGKIWFVSRRELPENKKVIILSATVDEAMYRALYGERVVFHDISAVQSLGHIEQNTKYSLSRESLKTESTLEWAVREAGDLPTITFWKRETEV